MNRKALLFGDPSLRLPHVRFSLSFSQQGFPGIQTRFSSWRKWQDSYRIMHMSTNDRKCIRMQTEKARREAPIVIAILYLTGFLMLSPVWPTKVAMTSVTAMWRSFWATLAVENGNPEGQVPYLPLPLLGTTPRGRDASDYSALCRVCGSFLAS